MSGNARANLTRLGARTAGGLLAVTIAAGDETKHWALRALSWFGGVHANPSLSTLADKSRETSEYLIVLKSAPPAQEYLGYIENHPAIEYLSPSIYPHTIRVSLRVPVAQTLTELESQPFVSFAIRNLPIFFCH